MSIAVAVVGYTRRLHSLGRSRASSLVQPPHNVSGARSTRVYVFVQSSVFWSCTVGYHGFFRGACAQVDSLCTDRLVSRFLPQGTWCVEWSPTTHCRRPCCLHLGLPTSGPQASQPGTTQNVSSPRQSELEGLSPNR